MAIYFVDYENVGSTGIEGIDTLSADNKVHIFYSVKADTMKMDQVIQLMRVAADVEFHDVTMRGQKNALDFQLIAMLYFTKKEEDTCYIISKDQGYDAAIIFGRKIGAEQVYRRVSINSENIGENKPQQQSRRSGKRSDNSRPVMQQEQPVLLAERAQGVTTLPYQREYIRPPRREAQRAAEQAKKEEVKAAEPVKKEELKVAEPVKKEEVKAAEPVKKEEPKAAEPVKKEEPKKAEPVKKEESKTAEPVKQEAAKTGIPNFRREVVVVKTVENTGKKQEKAAEPVKKEEPKAAEPVKQEETKAAEPVKKEEPKEAEPAKKEEQKDAEPAKQEEPKAVLPVNDMEEDLGFLKAAAQWDIFQSSIGGFFDYDIPAEYADGDDEDLTPEELLKNEPKEEEPKEEPVKKEEKHSRQRSRQSRRRSQRQKGENTQDIAKTENKTEEPKADESVKKEETKAAQPAKKEEPEGAESVKQEKASEAPAQEPKAEEVNAAVQEPKAEKPKKSSSRQKKKSAEEDPKKGDNTKNAEKEVSVVKDYKEVEKRVTEVMSAAGFTLEPEENALIAKALVSSSTKNQFYQFFRKTRGEAAGREFYLKIRGQYENLKVLREA